MQIEQYILDNYCYEPDTGRIFSLISNKYVGFQQEVGYIIVSFKKINKNYLAHHLAFLFQTGCFPILTNEKIVNHKNGIKNDNRWCNLEITSYSKNSICTITQRGISNYRGVYKKYNKWIVHSIIEGINYNLGVFSSALEAAEIYDDFIVFKIPNIDKKYLNFPNRINQLPADKYQKLVGRKNKKGNKLSDSEIISHIKKNFQYFPDTGNIKNLISGNFCCCSTTNGYSTVEFRVNGVRYSFLAHRIAWLLTYNNFPSQRIDHIDQNRKNNKLSNLRIVSTNLNALNIGKQKNNTSGYKGVSFFKISQQWRAYFTFYNKQFHLGLFTSIIKAAEAYDNFVYYIWQVKNILNFPDRTCNLPPQNIIDTLNQFIKSNNINLTLLRQQEQNK